MGLFLRPRFLYLREKENRKMRGMGIAKSRCQNALILYVFEYVYIFEILVTILQIWGRVLRKYPSAKSSFILLYVF
jgi:hypothetical protein